MNFKNRLWKIATVFIVLFIAVNPEMVELALFIDAIGLEMFVMLVEVQLIAIISLFYQSRIKPAVNYIQHVWLRRKPTHLTLVIPSPALLMNMLVVSAFIGIVFDVQ